MSHKNVLPPKEQMVSILIGFRCKFFDRSTQILVTNSYKLSLQGTTTLRVNILCGSKPGLTYLHSIKMTSTIKLNSNDQQHINKIIHIIKEST